MMKPAETTAAAVAEASPVQYFTMVTLRVVTSHAPDCPNATRVKRPPPLVTLTRSEHKAGAKGTPLYALTVHCECSAQVVEVAQL